MGAGLISIEKEKFLTDEDLHFFNEGTHDRIYRKFGAQLMSRDGVAGAQFTVWAPHARQVFVRGDFNGWDETAHPLEPLGRSGIWTGFVPGVRESALYKYHLVSQDGRQRLDKSDPVGFWHERSPHSASMVWDLAYEWQDDAWRRERGRRCQLDKPIAIYEVHLGSWMRVPEENNRFLTYREIAPKLADHAQQMGFTHVEFLPVMEHPFYGSWGYQITGYFAPTSRYGMPQDLMYLIDYLHQRQIGVILDWVPSHFPNDPHGLALFDGAPLYEHPDPRRGLHAEWNSCVFNYELPEVRSFLLSNALFWLDLYHADGLRVDAVASMLYRDYGRAPGTWAPNRFGGREDLRAIDFLRRLNETVYRHYPDVQTMAEESTAWPMVSHPAYLGGLGFGLKWDMGLTHDTLRYLARDPVQRKYHHDELTFRGLYYTKENYVLPLSHDDVAPGKGSLLAKMPGDPWRQFANLRLLLGYFYGQPGKKLLFMGDEFGQARDWQPETSLDWHQAAQQPFHAGTQLFVGDLNHLYRREPALHEGDCGAEGFDWVDCHDTDQSAISWLRWSRDQREVILVVCNFTPMVRQNYRLGVPFGGRWLEVLNSDARHYGGSGVGNLGGAEAAPFQWHSRPHMLTITLPPLSILFFKLAKEDA